MGGHSTGRNLFQKILFYICALTLITFTFAVLYSVFMRYALNAPPIWGEDVPKLLFVWLTFVGAALAMMLGMNIRLTYFVDKLRHVTRRRIEFVMHAITLVMLVVILRFSIPIIELTSRGTVLSTGWSNALTYLALPTGCVLMIGYELVTLWRLVRGAPIHDGDDPAEDI